MDVAFAQDSGVIVGLSQRNDGSMIWGNRLPVDETVRANRDRFFIEKGIDPSRVIAGGVVHGTDVARVSDKEAGQYLLNIDALVTNIPNLFLSITAADCMPLYFYDPCTHSIGIAHAGWRGMVGGAIENIINALQKTLQAKNSEIQVIIGPHIRSCHFEVLENVALEFQAQSVERRDGKLFVSLAHEATTRLTTLGISQIVQSSQCTYCQAATFYSARHDRSNPLQGMAAYIGLKN